jgi:hypothetical protein
MVQRQRAVKLWVLVLATVCLAAGPAWSQCDAENPDADCPERPIVVIRDALFTNPNGALFACAPNDDFCLGLLLSNQDGVSSQALTVEGQPRGAIGSRALLRLVDATAVICACPGGPGHDQDACARACLVGFRTGDAHESQRASCETCGQLTLNVRAREDVTVDDDDDRETPPVIEPLAYLLVGRARLTKATDRAGEACSATLVLDEIVPPFNFSFTLENRDHGSVTRGCL